MKLLLVHNTYQQQGGEDAVFANETALLQQYGHDVHTVVFDNDVIKTSWDKLKTGFDSVYATRSAGQITAAIRMFKPDVMHVHNFFPLASPAIFYAARRQGIPVVVTLHNYRLVCPGALLLRDGNICEDCVQRVFPWPAVRHGCYRQSSLATLPVALMLAVHKQLQTWQTQVDQYIALSAFSRDKFLQSALGILPEQISVKPNFVFDAGANTQSKGDFVVYAGRLTPEKGIATLLNAFSQLPHKLVILGTGPLAQMVMDYCRRYPQITYLGQQPPDIVRETIKQAKALIFPSIWYECFPMTIIEALCAGTPVIATPLGGRDQVIQHGVTGYHFSPNDCHELQVVVNMLFAEEDKYQQLCHNARTTYEQHYTPEHNYRALMSLYERIVTNPSPKALPCP